jgi:hypothetical protein
VEKKDGASRPFFIRRPLYALIGLAIVFYAQALTLQGIKCSLGILFMKRSACFAISTFLACGIASPVQADVYKCVNDATGQTTYTNAKPLVGQKGCSLMTKDQPVSTATGGATRKPSAAPSPSSFPKVDSDTQKSRDSDRRKILETERASETKNLEAAKKDLAEQEATRNGNERNYQKYLDRIQQYKDAVTLHERNIEALNKELAKLN